MIDLIRCSNGHRFPVNKQKHEHQTYVICPHSGCHERVQIHKRRLPFNPKWPSIKDETKESRLEAKEKKRRQPATPQILPGPTRIGMSQSLAGVLALSAAMKKAEEKREEEEKEE